REGRMRHFLRQIAMGLIDSGSEFVPGTVGETAELADDERYVGRVQLRAKPRDQIMQLRLVTARELRRGIRFSLMPQDPFERACLQRPFRPLHGIVPRMTFRGLVERARLPRIDWGATDRPWNQSNR